MTDDPLELAEEERGELLELARRSVEHQVRTGRLLRPDPEWVARRPRFQPARGVFVTLEKAGALRGCVGEIEPQRALHAAVIRAAAEAAMHDTRFAPVEVSELDEIALSVTVLGAPTPFAARDPEALLAEIEPGRDGVVLEYEGRRSTFLPQVWDQLPDPVDFLRRLSLKQGAPRDAWREPGAVLLRYRALCFGEPGRTKD